MRGSSAIRRGVALLLLALAWSVTGMAQPASADESVRIEYFWAEGCPYCVLAGEFLDDLESRFGDGIEVARYEVSADAEGRERWIEQLAARGRQASGVPTIVLDEWVWVGFDARVAESVTSTVEQRLAASGGEAPVDGPDPTDPDADPAADPTERIVVPVLGEVPLDGRSPIAATAMIAFVDGINPCSLWVLTVLLAMVLNAGATRGRVAIVGTVFLTVTAAIYGAFIVGAYTILGFLEHVGAIRMAVGLIALTVGAINVKDYLAFKRGISLTIPDRFKPRIYRGGRRVRDAGRSLPAVLATTVALAAGIALVELPCTAGFPVIWTGIVRSQQVVGAEFAGLLGLYLLIYVGLELVLFSIALVTLSVTTFEERHGRSLKLVGGAVMLALGVVLLTAPELLEDVGGAVLVVLGAIGVAALIDQMHRWLLRRRRDRMPVG